MTQCVLPNTQELATIKEMTDQGKTSPLPDNPWKKTQKWPKLSTPLFIEGGDWYAIPSFVGSAATDGVAVGCFKERSTTSG